MNIQELNKSFINCDCKREHLCPIDFVQIGKNAVLHIPELCGKYGNIMLVSDENTYNVCGERVHSLLADKVKKNLVLKSNEKLIIPNEEQLDVIKAELTEEIDLIVGVGSGVINDLCKYVSFTMDLPYYIVATAPSMDGYASVGAALILGGMKITLNARPPKAIIADTAVVKDAPMEMLQAGYGDIIGKYSCLNDWKLSALINNEYFCKKVYDLTYECVEKVRTLAEGIKNRDEETVGVLMEALVLVGVAMSYVNTSRPASGSEHHLSHYFEITGILDGRDYFAHGVDVGYSTVVTSLIREKILSEKPTYKAFDRAEWEKNIRKTYSSASDGVIELQDKLGWYNKDDSSVIYEKWNEITEILKEAPTADEVKMMLAEVNLDFDELEKMYGREKIDNAVLYAKDLKDRYSVLWLYYIYFREAK